MGEAQPQRLTRDGLEPPSDERRPADGEIPTFRQIYLDHATGAWRALRRLGVREADVEDACQDVFVVVHEKLAQFDHARPPRPWVLGICVKVAAKYRRRAHVQRETMTDAPFAITEPLQPRALEARQARELLEHMLARLTGEQREVFVLFELQELPMTEVAAIVEVPLQTAYSRLHAARKRVDAQIERLQSRGREVRHGS
jgi:RNA polymerase sigma-70 factor, ECF subfamily